MVDIHDTEWTPFQTHYFLENLVGPGIEPGTSGSVGRKSDHRGGLISSCRFPLSCTIIFLHGFFLLKMHFSLIPEVSRGLEVQTDNIIGH
jgi:hypothetical protein